MLYQNLNCVFFFSSRRRHTRFDCDWSSDVCSSDLLVVASGTMGNLVSVVSHTRAGQEVVLDLDSHIFNYEVAGAAVIGSVEMRPVKTAGGFLTAEQVHEALRPANIHIPPTGLVCIENTHNRHGGTCCTPEEIGAAAAVAHDAGVPVHLDGARIFNAAVALRRPASDFARHADSVTFCLSKGLGAPVGSVVCASRELVARARRVRKMVGGGMRQAGVLAAAGIVALERVVDRLGGGHAQARPPAQGGRERGGEGKRGDIGGRPVNKKKKKKKKKNGQ